MNLTRHKPLFILTGAGISAESGIRTFRASDGLWEDHRIEDVATPEAYERNPKLVHTFYNMRRAQLQLPEIKPNKAHEALAKLEQEWEGPFLLVTQNVDDLHERAGSKNVIHMHGSLLSAWCLECDARMHWPHEMSAQSVCAKCAKPGGVRPDIVWFGEMPYKMEEIEGAVQSCKIFLSIGTSGLVYPAAGFAGLAWKAERIEANLEATAASRAFHRHIHGPATETVPKLAEELLRA